MIFALILVWLENRSFKGSSFARSFVQNCQILTKKVVHLIVTVDALDMAIISRLGANQNFVR